MDFKTHYLDHNRALWNEKTQYHIDSEFYNQEAFLKGASSLKSIELDLLGDVAGSTVLHLQCHFGQDTLSLARMGASVTGADLSDKAIEKATALAAELQLDVRFVCSDVYRLPDALDERFDTVFTTYGVLGWLPDMREWARIAAYFLKPGGRLVLVEFHPAVWMFDNGFTHIAYSYFNKEVIVEHESGTYADRSAPVQLPSVNWNHALSDVLQALIDAGLRIEVFREYDWSPYNCFPNTVETAPGMFHIVGMEGKLPMVYALRAVKP